MEMEVRMDGHIFIVYIFIYAYANMPSEPIVLHYSETNAMK